MRPVLFFLSFILVAAGAPAPAQEAGMPPEFILQVGADEPRSRLIMGDVIGLNALRQSVQIRRVGGGDYSLNAGNAEFRAYVDGEMRPAEFVDLRPGQRLEAKGILRPNGIVDTAVVLIRDQPRRLRTADPFAAPSTSTARQPAPVPAAPPREQVAGQIVEALLAIRGTILSVDRPAGSLRVRTGEDVVTVRTNAGTEYRGIEAKAPGLEFFRPGDVVTIGGTMDGGALTAERVTLVPPQETTPAEVRVEVNEAPVVGETSAFTGVLVSMDRARTRARLRLANEERVVLLRGTRFTRNALTVQRTVLRPGMRLLVRAVRRGDDWVATDVRIL